MTSPLPMVRRVTRTRGDLYTKYTYETDYNSSIEMKVFKESGRLEDITIRNFVAPDDFEAGAVNEEVPAEITAYQKPEGLSDDLAAYEIELDGTAYRPSGTSERSPGRRLGDQSF